MCFGFVSTSLHFCVEGKKQSLTKKTKKLSVDVSRSPVKKVSVESVGSEKEKSPRSVSRTSSFTSTRSNNIFIDDEVLSPVRSSLTYHIHTNQISLR